MNSLTAQQLAFILDIKVQEARAKLCHAWCKFHGIENKAYFNENNKIVDDYPNAIPIGMISQTLCIDNLQDVVDDVRRNFLTRPATRTWILCDYPEKELAIKAKNKIKVPSALKSFLSDGDVEFIKAQWHKRYGIQY